MILATPTLNNSNNLTIDLLYQQAIAEKPFGWFPSSPELCDRILSVAHLQPGTQCLEPQAGAGHLAIALRNAGAAVDCMEVDPTLRQLLFQQGFRLVGRDFLTAVPEQRYPCICQNPPFSSRDLKGIDLDHVRQAYRFLSPGGRLVSVNSESMYCRHSRAQRFRAGLQKLEHQVIDLPPDIFASTDRPVAYVKCYLLVIDKPG